MTGSNGAPTRGGGSPEVAVSAVPERPVSKCPLAHRAGRAAGDVGVSIVPIRSRPVDRRTALRRTGVVAGAMAALGTLELVSGARDAAPGRKITA